MKQVPYGKIILIDDDINVTYILKRFLELKNFKVDLRYDSQSGFEAIINDLFDLIIINMDLDCGAGLNLLQKVRNSGIITPSIIMTNKYSLDSEIESYRSGSNLFHKKPVEFRLLEVQVNSLIQNRQSEVFIVGDLEIDLTGRRIYKNGVTINLTKLEFSLLVLLLKSKGKLFSREEIMRKVFFDNKDISFGAVDTLVSRLRKKLGRLQGEYLIETVFKSGYRVSEYYIER